MFDGFHSTVPWTDSMPECLKVHNQNTSVHFIRILSGSKCSAFQQNICFGNAGRVGILSGVHYYMRKSVAKRAKYFLSSAFIFSFLAFSAASFRVCK